MGKYRAYPEYRESGAEWMGKVPSEWGVSKVSYVSQCLDGKRIPLNATERGVMQGDIPYWGANGVVDHINDWLFDEELVLLGEDGAPFFDPFKPVAFRVSGKMWVNNHTHILRANSRKVVPTFLAQALNSVQYQYYITGSTRDKLTQSDMGRIQIHLPSLEEQTQIAAFLDRETAKIDRLIVKQEALIELLKEKRQAVISHAVTKGLDPDAPMKDSGVEWLGEIPAHWKVVQLGHVAISMQTGPFGSQLHAEDYSEGGTPVINPAHMVEGTICPDEKCAVDGGKLEQLAHHQLRAQDIVFARRGELGRCALVTDHESGWLCGTGSVKVTLNMSRLAPDSLLLFMGTSSARDALSLMSKGSTMENLNTEILGKLRIPLPQMDEQVRIVGVLADRLTKITLLREKVESAIGLLQERRTALISAAVTGKIDVREEV